MTHLFSDDAWCGGFYELALEYPGGDSAPVVAGLHAVWGLPVLDGCYLERAEELNAQHRVDFSSALDWQNHIQGIATLEGNRKTACGTCCVPEDGGSNWLVFYLPMGSLGNVLPVHAFPFDTLDHDNWRVPLDCWLAQLGQTVFLHAPFLLGLVGFECSGEACAADLARSGIPSSRQSGLLVPSDAGLTFYPRTQ